MPGKQILIVDDQRETTRVLRSSLESLKQELEISDVLSGEEAILELGHGPIDLLISDVLLPGISGLELMSHFRNKYPDCKVILVSGVTDEKIKHEVAQAGADAFFFKPIDLADFLDSVERSLGLVDTILPPELQVAKENVDEEKEAKGLSERIAQLQNDLKASAVFLLGDVGQVLVRAGKLPDGEIEQVLIPDLMAGSSIGLRISTFMGNDFPNNLLSFHGKSYDLHLAHVGEAYSLLITTEPASAKDTSKIALAIQDATQGIKENLSKLGISTQAREPVVEKAPEPKVKPLDPDISDPELDTLLAKNAKVKKEEADKFWETLSEEQVTPELTSSDSLTYEQAKQLGLAPNDE